MSWYQFPMGKVKKNIVEPFGYGGFVSIPYGKGKVDKDMLIGLNPKFLYTALSLYHKLGIDYTVKTYGRIANVVISGGDFINLVVPMRISEGRDKESIVKEYVA